MKSINGKFKPLFAIIVLTQLIACQNSAEYEYIKEERIIRLIGQNLKQILPIVMIRVDRYIGSEIMDSEDFFVRKGEMIGSKKKKFVKNSKGQILFGVDNKPIVREIDFTTNCRLMDIFLDAHGNLSIKYIDAEGREFVEHSSLEYLHLK